MTRLIPGLQISALGCRGGCLVLRGRRLAQPVWLWLAGGSVGPFAGTYPADAGDASLTGRPHGATSGSKRRSSDGKEHPIASPSGAAHQPERDGPTRSEGAGSMPAP